MTGSMAMTDKDLIDMLRTKQICVGFKPDGNGDVDIVYGPDPVTVEAAARIEAMQAQNLRLSGMVHDLRKEVADTDTLLIREAKASLDRLERAEKAEAERDRLRDALERIAGVKGPYSHPFPESNEGYGSFAIVTAREALKGEKA